MKGNVEPLKITKLLLKGRCCYKICVNIKKDEFNEYTWDDVYLKPGEPLNYDNVVSALINFKYPADKMQAIINNYLLEPTDSNIKKEFNEMQIWRKYSKEYAKQILQENK